MSFDNESYLNNSGGEASEPESAKNKFQSQQTHGSKIQIVDQVEQKKQEEHVERTGQLASNASFDNNDDDEEFAGEQHGEEEHLLSELEDRNQAVKDQSQEARRESKEEVLVLPEKAAKHNRERSEPIN